MDTTRADQTFDTVTPARPRQQARDTYDDRRNHILRSATRVFAQMGYEKASMRMIARAADSSLAGLYHYFASKEQLLFVMQFRVFSSLLTNLREKLHGVETPADRLRVLVQEHVSYFAANMAELKVCSHELDSLSGEAYEQTRTIRREYFAIARSIIGELINAHPRTYPLDVHVATMTLFGTLNWLYRWFNPARGASPRTLATQITNQFLYGLNPAPTTDAPVPNDRET